MKTTMDHAKFLATMLMEVSAMHEGSWHPPIRTTSGRIKQGGYYGILVDEAAVKICPPEWEPIACTLLATDTYEETMDWVRTILR